MKFPTAVTVLVGRQVLLLKKNSPAIMFGAGIFSAGASTVLACKATLKLEEVVAKHEDDRNKAQYLRTEVPNEYTEKDLARDGRIIRLRMTTDLLKLYGPAIGVGVLSIGLLTTAHVTLTKRNAALIAAYNAVDLAFKEYRSRVRAELGEDKDREFLFGTVEKEIVEEGEHGHVVKTVKRAKGPHSPYARVFDENLGGVWSNSAINNRSFLMAQQNYLNDLLQSRGHVLLNDVYDVLHMERSEAGTVVGWVKGHGDNMVDFGLFNSPDPIVRDFMMLEHNDGIILDFNVDGVVNDLIKRKY